MGVFSKLKDVLFDIEEENEIPVITKEEQDDNPIKEVKMPKEEIEDEFEPIEEIVKEKPKKEFNFPLDDDFEEEIPSRSLRSNNSFFDEEFTRKSDLNVKQEKPIKKYDDYEYDYSRLNVKETKKETNKTFTPSPVISPVYGILDTNYTKDDVIVKNNGSKRKEVTPNLDEVRKRAYGKKKEEKVEVAEEIETLKKIDDILIEDQTEEIPKIKEVNDMPILDEKTPIGVYDDELPDEPYADEIINDNEEEPKNDLETDLFNLIDSMYEEKNERDEEE